MKPGDTAEIVDSYCPEEDCDLGKFVTILEPAEPDGDDRRWLCRSLSSALSYEYEDGTRELGMECNIDEGALRVNRAGRTIVDWLIIAVLIAIVVGIVFG